MNEVAVIEHSGRALMSASDILTQVKTVQEVMRSVMRENTHFGKIPGTDKPTLLKPGAEVLCAVFHVADSYRIEDLSVDDCIRYRITCVGTHQASGTIMGEGIGECSSDEEKYRWVKAYDTEFNHTDDNRRRIRYGWNKTDRKEYQIKQVRTNPADMANTILKMAAKRAKIAMTLNVTAASDIFTQDVEDLDERLREQVAGDGGSEGGDQAKKPPKQPTSKSGKSDKTATDDKGKPDETPASAGMLAHVRKRLEAAALTEAECFKKFGMTTFDGATVARANEILHWIANPAPDAKVGDATHTDATATAGA